MKATIILADDHPLLLSGTQQFLEKKGLKIVSTAVDGNQAYNAILKYEPDLAILDFDMPIQNGIEVAKQCLQKKLKVKIIILTLYKEEAIIKEVGTSIQGYILKDDALSEIAFCIAKVLKGGTYISENLKESIHLPNKNNKANELTVAEIKILKYLAKDLSSTQIAEVLFISKRTVEKHRSNIIKKLGIPSTQNGLLLWVQQNPELFNT